ncbi:hypothetical protein ULMS_08100 [Patiriisocius marinistellae]|uniref:CHAT domain-containing protein n=1 Tax=Patiriisocius marinistellae TaxID=2494560 RepID=A0A5J4FVY1_9FLAO|nr:CHAT domain-containing protein [Patiriisocius marinistellae]GEQ85302.1 hypothetical protein ULMS_08100 [Patiriisocius marinistellae]
MMLRYKCSLLFIFFSIVALSQNTSIIATTTIDSLFTADKNEAAEQAIKKNIALYFSEGPLDSLYRYPQYIGKTTLLKANTKDAEEEALKFIEKLKNLTKNPRTLYKSYVNLNELYLDLQDNKGATDASILALEYALKTSDINDEELGRVYYILGSNYYALYEDEKSLKNLKKSVFHYKKSSTADKYRLADAYNGVATGLWALNKLDSAEVYYRNAIDLAKKSELKEYNKSYYIAAFQFNLALVIDDQGKINDAIEMKKKIIKTFQEIIEKSDDKILVQKAKRLEAGAIANLAALYNDIGYVDRAHKMLLYSYEKKKQVYDLSDPNMVSMLTKIANAAIGLGNYEEALKTLQISLKNLKKSKTNYPTVEANIYFWLAKTYEEKMDTNSAQKFYKKSDSLYQKTNETSYSRDYTAMLHQYTLFLANQKNKEEAVTKAKALYHYVSKNVDDSNLIVLRELMHLSEIHFTLNEYEQSLIWAQKANNFITKKLQGTTNGLDSIQIEFRRPAIIYFEVASLLKIEKNKSPEFLSKQISKIEKAVASLERRKITITTQSGVTEILELYKKLNDLSKELHNTLYKKTKSPELLDKILTLQESSVYQRIRTQLQTKQQVKYNKIPAEILKKETKLINDLSLTDRDTAFNITTYFEAQQRWTNFLDTLKTKYPSYHNLKYASLEIPIDNLQTQIPENTTLVRYFFIADQLYVFIISETQKKIIPLQVDELSNRLSNLTKQWQDIANVSKKLEYLYQDLWAPFSKEIKTQNVLIIPDGVLYNLSFETLLTAPITSFSDFTKHSLLAKHTISYNYSALLVDKNKTTTYFSDNYVGFAPEFTTQMKDGYQLKIRDSLQQDKAYLTLLPQPFITQVTKDFSKKLGGKSFLNEKASKAVFLKNAKEHKIIHIGTHAESNNLYPELSRLIFAKNTSSNVAFDDNENSLYTFEIYDSNLSANLAILTACETGKPTHQPGEGMISLAHAFNFAGAESMLTSLWKIDEKSSAEITSYFYENLKDGMKKDMALQQAKLTYLSYAKGRTLAPQYWAGLVLIGDTTPIDFKNPSYLWIIIGGVLIVLLIVFLLRKFVTQRTQ